jgi:superfamily I DNA/RNA helicase
MATTFHSVCARLLREHAQREQGSRTGCSAAWGCMSDQRVKDALAYLTLLVNPADAQAFRRAIQSPRRGIGPATANVVVTRAREEWNGDLILACARVDEIDGVRSGEARQRLTAFGEGMSAARRDIELGRSLGHAVLAAVMLDGGLVHHYEQRRDTSPDAAARRDAERVLEDLRSLKDRLILTHVRTRAGRDTSGPSRFLYEAGVLSRPTAWIRADRDSR